MNRSNERDTAGRLNVALSRGILVQSDDKPMLQQATVKAFWGEQMTEVEHFHQYGFTAVPKKPDSPTSRAEVIFAFQNGDRSHPFIVQTIDRRYRPKGREEGEVTLHDDQKQEVYITRKGIQINGGPSKLPVTITVGNAIFKVEDGKITAQVDQMFVVVKPNRIDLGKENAPDAVVTTAGPSTKVFAIV